MTNKLDKLHCISPKDFWKLLSNGKSLDNVFDFFKELVSGSENKGYEGHLDMNTEYFILL